MRPTPVLHGQCPSQVTRFGPWPRRLHTISIACALVFIAGGIDIIVGATYRLDVDFCRKTKRKILNDNTQHVCIDFTASNSTYGRKASPHSCRGRSLTACEGAHCCHFASQHHRDEIDAHHPLSRLHTLGQRPQYSQVVPAHGEHVPSTWPDGVLGENVEEELQLHLRKPSVRFCCKLSVVNNWSNSNLVEGGHDKYTRSH